MGILADYNGIVFLHPMKTAMSSIRHFMKDMLRKHYGKHCVLGGTEHFIPDEILWRHKGPESIFSVSLKVIFVRNPYDRLVSFYHHMRQIGGHAEGICNRLSFREFALHPQLNRIMIPCSQYCTHGIDFLGRYESLDDDVHRLIDVIGFGDKTAEVHDAWCKADRLMRTEREPYEQYYDTTLFNHVHSVYEADFKSFEYEVN